MDTILEDSFNMHAKCHHVKKSRMSRKILTKMFHNNQK